MTQEALKLALEALEGAEALLLSMGLTHLNIYGDAEKAITAIKEALAQPEQEPVAWADHGVVNWIADKQFKHASLLYTTPPQRTWVGLTDEEYKELHLQMGPVYYYQEYGQAIEAKLKEKNT